MQVRLLPLLLLLPTTAFGLLDDKIKAVGKKYFGNILDVNRFNDSKSMELARTEFSAYTPEYSAKWSHIHPQRNEFTFAAFDSVVDFAEKRGGIIRGHTLIWHNSLPQWVKDVNNATELRSIIEHHITTIVSRYKGRIYAWDVVNEIFKDDGSLRDSVFSRVLGDEFVEIAFNAAHAADPNAKLYINDYGLDRANNPKINALVKLVKHLKSNGVPLDGVGSQTHLTLGGAGTVKGALEQLAAAWKIEIAITELDIRVPTPVTNDKLVRQQQEYNTVVKACLEIPKCVGISIWGISDKHSWIQPETQPGFDSPLLWDDKYDRKKAYSGVESAIASQPSASPLPSPVSNCRGRRRRRS